MYHAAAAPTPHDVFPEGSVVKPHGQQGASRGRRQLFVGLLAFAATLAYCDRVNISVAIIDMAAQHGWTMNERGQVGCTL